MTLLPPTAVLITQLLLLQLFAVLLLRPLTRECYND